MKIRDIIKTENIIRVGNAATLSSVAGKLSSAHDSAFVFDDDESYVGVVNPYYCFIKTIYPSHTKVSSCMIHAPKIKCSDYLPRAARMMLESKIHYLPVFENDKFIGIISARRLIEAAINSGLLDISISELLKTKKPVVTINEKSDLGQAIKLFKDTRVSKLVVVDDSGRLKGILSFFDLIPLFMEPRQKPSYMARIGEKYSFQQHKIKNYYKSLVLTISPAEQLKTAAELILKREIGSVLIIDQNKKPLGIITTKDLLLRWINQNDKKYNVIKNYKELDNDQKQLLENYINHLIKIFYKHKVKIDTVNLNAKKNKRNIMINIELISKNKTIAVIKKQDVNFNSLLNQIKKTITNFIDKNKN